MFIKIMLIGFLTGTVGTLIGGIIALFFKKNIDSHLSTFMGLAGGIMLAVVSFELLDESMKQIGVKNALIFAVGGILISVLLKNMLHFDGMLKTGYLIFASILIHNFPEGLAIGSSFLWKGSLGVTLSLIIGLHNIPEGLAMALSLIKGKMNTFKVLIFTAMAGVPMALGSFMGAYLGNMFAPLIGAFLAMAGGTMLYITIEEIFPSAKPTYSIVGFLIGIIIVKTL